MKKLFGFLKPYALQVVVIICVLMVQAYCDLSLPAYTSDIVNVGIQQSGIDEKVPEALAGEDLNLILAFVPEEDRAEVADAYEESSDSYDYEGTVMALKEQVKEDDSQLEELSDQMGLPMVMAMAAEERGINMNGAEGMTGEASGQMEDLPDSMVEQAVAAYIQSAYERSGSTWAISAPGISWLPAGKCFCLPDLEWQPVSW